MFILIRNFIEKKIFQYREKAAVQKLYNDPVWHEVYKKFYDDFVLNYMAEWSDEQEKEFLKNHPCPTFEETKNFFLTHTMEGTKTIRSDEFNEFVKEKLQEKNEMVNILNYYFNVKGMPQNLSLREVESATSSD